MAQGVGGGGVSNSRVILIHITILVVVQLLGLLLGVVLGLLLVEEAEPLRLGQLVDLGPRDPREQLLGQRVADRLARGALLVLPQVHRLEGGRAADQLVRELALARLAVVDLVAGLLGFAWGGVSWGERRRRGLG